jgi:hypothetical protein
MSDEWGPWIEHSGRGYPVPPGTTVEAIERSGRREIVTVRWAFRSYNAWDWKTCPDCADQHVIRYRIRKPRGLTILQNLLAELPAPTRGRVE